MRNYVEEYRLKKELSLSELSRRSGVAVSHIHNIESGTKAPSVDILCKLSKVLDVDWHQLASCD